MDVVGTNCDHLAAEVERVERLDHHLVALGALELVGACVLEIRHYMVYRRFHGVGGSLVELHTVAGIGHLGARDDKTGAVIEYIHGQISPSTVTLLIYLKFALATVP